MRRVSAARVHGVRELGAGEGAQGGGAVCLHSADDVIAGMTRGPRPVRSFPVEDGWPSGAAAGSLSPKQTEQNRTERPRRHATPPCVRGKLGRFWERPENALRTR